MAGGRIVTSAHVLAYVNGKLLGRVTGFTWNASTPAKEIGGIDTVEVLELAPTTSKCMASMELFRTIGDGGIEGLGIQPTSPELPRGKYFTVMLIERTSDTVIFQADYCKVEAQAWVVSPKSFVRGNVSFKALSWNNEVRPLKR